MKNKFDKRRDALKHLKDLGWKVRHFWRDGSVTVSHPKRSEGYDVFKVGKGFKIQWKVEQVWEAAA